MYKPVRLLILVTFKLVFHIHKKIFQTSLNSGKFKNILRTFSKDVIRNSYVQVVLHKLDKKQLKMLGAFSET